MKAQARSASWVAHAVKGNMIGADTIITGPMVTDSREVEPGALYIARRGDTADGHQYVDNACARGAVVAIVERPLSDSDICQIIVPDSTIALADLARAHLEDLRKNHPLGVIAVTGSAGKTTTKDLLSRIMATDGETVAPVLSYNNEVGVPLTILRADENTRHLILEMGTSGPGEISFLTSIAPPDVAIELMVGTAHRGGFGSLEATARAKAELVEGLLPGGTAVINADDPYVRTMAQRVQSSVIAFTAREPTDFKNGLEGAKWVYATDIEMDDDGRASFLLHTPQTCTPVHLAVVGWHQVYNALAAAAAAWISGIDTETIARTLNDSGAASPHRMAVHSISIPQGHSFTLIDDSYNANPDSVAEALRTLEYLSGKGRGQRIAVFSEMLELGEESVLFHEEIGRQAVKRNIDVLITIGTGAQPILRGAAEVKVDSSCLLTQATDVEDAVRILCDYVKDGDFVLIKGSFGSGAWKVADEIIKRG